MRRFNVTDDTTVLTPCNLGTNLKDVALYELLGSTKKTVFFYVLGMQQPRNLSELERSHHDAARSVPVSVSDRRGAL